MEVIFLGKQNIKKINIKKPSQMEYYVNIETPKGRKKFIDRTERCIRSSMEYRDYIAFLKEHMDLNRCVFFSSIETSKSNRRNKISIEMHHEPFTLYEYVDTVLRKYEDTGEKINDLLISDEVMNLHYSNMVGLVPLSKTMHQMAHNSTKIMIPLNVCYGNYSKFLEEYDQYITDDMYQKLEKKIDMTNSLTPESFDALKKEFTYIEVKGFNDICKIDLSNSQMA